jgi:hypothetical protein
MLAGKNGRITGIRLTKGRPRWKGCVASAASKSLWHRDNLNREIEERLWGGADNAVRVGPGTFTARHVRRSDVENRGRQERRFS